MGEDQKKKKNGRRSITNRKLVEKGQRPKKKVIGL